MLTFFQIITLFSIKRYTTNWAYLALLLLSTLYVHVTLPTIKTYLGTILYLNFYNMHVVWFLKLIIQLLLASTLRTQ